MYTVGVIGLGNIAAMYGKPGERTPYCHVGGIRKSGTVRLAAVADRLELAREVFRERWGESFPGVAYHDGSASLLAEVPDIVAVCVRGPEHFDTMMEVIASGPKAIFLEKPPTCSLAEMDEMTAAAKAKGIPITVSYSRHWAPHILRLQQLVREGLIGDVRTVIGYTGYAFLSFASHVTDLICQFAGYCPASVYARGHMMGVDDLPDGYEPEPYLDNMLIEFANGVHGTQVGTNGEHGGFYCDVLGSQGMVRAGMYIPPVALDKDRNPIPLEMPPAASVFTVAYDQIAGYLEGGPLPHCTDHDFVVVNEIGFAGIESVLTGKPVRVPNANRTRRIWANG